MPQYINKDALVAEIKARINDIEVAQKAGIIKKRDADMKITLFKSILSLIDTLEVKEVEESVSEGLEEAVNAYIGYAPEVDECLSVYGKRQAFKAGAKWQKNHLWKSAEGTDLPIFNREVIVFTQPYPLEGNEYAVSFAHRPNPDGWDGKSLTSGKVEHYTPKTYGKGGWNIPNIMYWLDVELPKE